ncbi:MAG: septum formation protein Maf [Saprospiraceae bacterium]|nr:septum formation protein Maf [Saprospiraceae bacterium]
MSFSKLLETPILLASGSPRRRYLLEEAGFTPRVIPPDVDETYPEMMSPTEVPLYLAKLKAKTLLKEIRNNETILAADSIVVVNDLILGKPDDRADAIQMLTLLSGQTHQVITGVCLLSREQEMTFSCTSEVSFYSLTNTEIEYYIDRFKPYDKAGSYGVQEWLGWCKIRSIKGSYSNIMGLPMAMTYHKLQQFGDL